MSVSKRLLWATLLLALLGTQASASYTTATIVVHEQLADGGVRLTVRFTGDAGEPPVDRQVSLNSASTGPSLRRWAIQQRDEFNVMRTLAPGLQVGSMVDLTTMPPSVPTARDVWMQKALRLDRIKRIGLTNAQAIADINALQADVDTTYQAGFIDAF